MEIPKRQTRIVLTALGGWQVVYHYGGETNPFHVRLRGKQQIRYADFHSCLEYIYLHSERKERLSDDYEA